MIDISKINDFPNHPFKVKRDEELEELVESIRQNKRISQPVIVRKTKDGKYEMVSGHRRKLAYEILGLKSIPAIIRELTKEEAIIEMVDSNIQREKILPSERAFAYKMKMEAMKSQGKRNDITSCQLGTKLRTDEKISKLSEDSARQIQRYIRLTNLVKGLLDKVDNDKIAFSPAVEISYLKDNEQHILLDCIEMYDSTPSYAQAIQLKKLSQVGQLSDDKISEIMEEEKPNQIPKYKIDYKKFQNYLPRTVVTEKEVEEYILNCVKEHYIRNKNRKMER